MKNSKKLLLFALLCVFSLSVSAFAAESELKSNVSDAGKKLYRGASNFFSAPLEYLIRWDEMQKKTDNQFEAFFGGAWYGTWHTAARLVTGAVEVATFPFPIPENYEPIMNPPTAWDRFSELKSHTT